MASDHKGDPRLALGRLGEAMARRHYERIGFRALAGNQRMRAGELDLVVARSPLLVFAEIKTRRVSPGHGWRSESDLRSLGWPSGGQRRRHRRAAAEWLRVSEGKRPWLPDMRFDVVKVTLDSQDALVGLEHVEGI